MQILYINPDSLVRFYNKQNPAMQAALRAYWRHIAASTAPDASSFAAALGELKHEHDHPQ